MKPLLLLAFASLLLAQDGAGLYQNLCASCHDVATRRTMSAERILAALESGIMVPVAARRTPLERRAIAEFASGQPLKEPLSLKPIPQATCGTDPGTAVDPASVGSWNGWGAGAANTRFQPVPGLTAAQVPKLKLKWAFAFPGEISSDAAVTVAAGRLFIGSQSGLVYSLDAASGCIHWIFQAESAVRAAVSIARVSTTNGPRDFAFVGDGAANVYALEAATGRFLWRTKAAPTGRIAGSPVFHEARLYIPVISDETRAGSLVALEAASGKPLWTASAAVSATPTIDPKSNLVYVIAGDEVVALDLQKGQRQWSRSLPADEPGLDGSASPLLAALPGGKRGLLVGRKSGIVYALDPDNKGEILWQTRIGKGGALGGIQGGLASDGRNLYAALSGDGARNGGGLFALRLGDGKRLWEAPPGSCGLRPRCSPAQSQAVSAIPGAMFSGSVDGHIRAYSTVDGKLVWDFDTFKTFETVNAVPGRGGSLDGPGPVVAKGIVYVNSGYALAGGRPGNVLLAFSQNGI